MRKRLLSLLLSLALCLSLLPTAVFAEEGESEIPNTSVTDPSETPETPAEPTYTLSPKSGSTIEVYTGQTFTTTVEVTGADSACTFSWAMNNSTTVSASGSPQNTSNSSTQTWRASIAPGSVTIYLYIAM